MKLTSYAMQPRAMASRPRAKHPPTFKGTPKQTASQKPGPFQSLGTKLALLGALTLGLAGCDIGNVFKPDSKPPVSQTGETKSQQAVRQADNNYAAANLTMLHLVQDFMTELEPHFDHFPITTVETKQLIRNSLKESQSQRNLMDQTNITPGAIGNLGSKKPSEQMVNAVHTYETTVVETFMRITGMLLAHEPEDLPKAVNDLIDEHYAKQFKAMEAHGEAATKLYKAIDANGGKFDNPWGHREFEAPEQ